MNDGCNRPPTSYDHKTCADPESFFRGSNFDYVYFLVDTTMSGPLSSRQQNAIEMAFCWRDGGGPSLNADLLALWFYRGSRPVLLRDPIFFVFFQGGGGPDPLSSL